MNETRIVNTSPLIYLSRGGFLELLRMEADRVLVPHEVVEEIHAWHTADEAQRAVRTTPWLQIVHPIPVPSAIAVWDLGAGESAVLAHAMSQGPGVAVIDDLAARRCAATFNLPVRGTLGLVLRARQRGVIASARSVLEKLRGAGMFLSDRVLDAALQEVGE